MTKIKNYIVSHPIPSTLIALGVLITIVGPDLLGGMLVGAGLGNLFGRQIVEKVRSRNSR